MNTSDEPSLQGPEGGTLSEHLEALASNVGGLEARAEELERHILSFASDRREQEALTSQLLDLRTELAELAAERDRARAEIGGRQERVRALTNEIESLEAHATQLRSQIDKLEQRLVELDRLAPSIVERTTQVTHLEQETHAATQALERSRTELAVIENQRELEQARLDLLQERVLLLEQSRQEHKHFMVEVRDLTARRDDLARQIGDMEAKALRAEAKLAGIERERTAIAEEADRLRQETITLRTEREGEQAQVVALRKQIELLQGTEQDRHRVLGELADLETRRDALAQEIRELQTTGAEAQAELDAKRQQQESAAAQIALFRQELARLEEQREEQNRRIAASREHVQLLGQARQERDALLRELTVLREERQAIQQKNAELEAEAANAANRLANVEQRRADVERATGDLVQLRREKAAIEASLAEEQSIIERLNGQRQDLRNWANRSRSELDRLESMARERIASHPPLAPSSHASRTPDPLHAELERLERECASLEEKLVMIEQTQRQTDVTAELPPVTMNGHAN